MSLTVADVDTPLGLAEQQGGLAHVVQPPDALLALDGHPGRIDLPFQGGGALELLPGPELHGRQAQRQPLGGDRPAGVHQQPADGVLAIPALLVLAAVDAAGLADPLGPAPPAGELGRVVEHHDRAADAVGPVARRAEVAAEDLPLADPVVGEEAVGRLGGGPVLAGEGGCSRPSRPPSGRAAHATVGPAARRRTGTRRSRDRSRHSHPGPSAPPRATAGPTGVGPSRSVGYGPTSIPRHEQTMWVIERAAAPVPG